MDEISLLLWPTIDGTTVGSTIFEKGYTSVGQQLKLALSKATRHPSGAVHLQYCVTTRTDA